MAKHKNWKDYTDKEIRNIIEEKCKKCPYASGKAYLKADGVSAITCDYIGVTGHSRGCKPDECEHYLDDPKRVKEIREDYRRHGHIYANEVNAARRKEQIKW